ncbi:HesA/MoeB/ThiF family protein [Aquicoccus porphyridii]|uniref:Molybdopterin-synthase adenylyltransferase n=1 Tax=Aquicoccus porphyridii TaxID=1852029 RepID=A0A5A9YYC9_9RHOB|nr:HesA/MoeB/ThiF family protein [Aquicoccus porphyridii]KAA0909864.1 HesA/MoeB/ThiF family protein [Aquicoccus porphyridii]RAI53224.1 molybdopterin biosynthesis protein [Rhodobacteraceae bacterium AsT-22]
MLAVLGIMAVVWGMGRALRLPGGVVWSLIALVYIAVLVIQLVFPDAHPLRVATGGGPEGWLILGGVVALVGLYMRGLAWLKRRAAPVEEAETPAQGVFAPGELNRYARHVVLRELGGPGQKKLKQSKVLVIGAGGLGSPVLLYLAAAGVGRIGVIDDDVVEASNLQRQVVHTDGRTGMPKVQSAMQAMEALNPYVEVRPYQRRLTGEIAGALFADYDLVIDGTDNFDTRYLANRTCVDAGKPLISGAIAQWEGQVSLFDPARGGPCYQCIFPEAPAPELAPSCAEAGVVSPLPGVVGSMMALEAVKAITGAGETLRGQMMIFDGLHGESRKMRLKPRPDCPVCAGRGGEG